MPNRKNFIGAILSDPRDAGKILADAEVLSGATPEHVFYHAASTLIYCEAAVGVEAGEGWAKCKYEIGVAVYDDGEYYYYYDNDVGNVLDLDKLKAAWAAVGGGYEGDAKRPFGALPHPGTFAEAADRRSQFAGLVREVADAVKSPVLIALPAWVLVTPNTATVEDGFPVPAGFREVYAGILETPAEAYLPAPLRPPRVDLFIALSHTIGTSLKLRRRSELAVAGVEVKVIDDAGRENQITGAAVFTLIALLRYVAGVDDPFVGALWRQRGEIWTPGPKALYKYCFANAQRSTTHADRLRIRRGINDLQKPQLVVYKDGNVIRHIERPWVRVEKTTLTAERAKVINAAFSAGDKARIADGVIFIPDAAIDLIAENGFIKVWPDLNDRLVAAAEKTGLEITADRVAFLIDLAKTLGEIADGVAGGDYEIEPGRYVIRRTPAALVDAFGLKSVKRRRQTSLLTKKIKDTLNFAEAGGFIESYALRNNVYNLIINRYTERLLKLRPRPKPKSLGGKT